MELVLAVVYLITLAIHILDVDQSAYRIQIAIVLRLVLQINAKILALEYVESMLNAEYKTMLLCASVYWVMKVTQQEIAI